MNNEQYQQLLLRYEALERENERLKVLLRKHGITYVPDRIKSLTHHLTHPFLSFQSDSLLMRRCGYSVVFSEEGKMFMQDDGKVGLLAKVAISLFVPTNGEQVFVTSGNINVLNVPIVILRH